MSDTPRPTEYSEWKVWAMAFWQWLQNDRRVVRRQTVALESLPTALLPAPSEDGLLMHDSTLGKVVVSQGGVWEALH